MSVEEGLEGWFGVWRSGFRDTRGRLGPFIVNLAESRDPRILESGRVDLIRDGAWISE